VHGGAEDRDDAQRQDEPWEAHHHVENGLQVKVEATPK
jgi:hypothetical protein